MKLQEDPEHVLELQIAELEGQIERLRSALRAYVETCGGCGHCVACRALEDRP